MKKDNLLALFCVLLLAAPLQAREHASNREFLKDMRDRRSILRQNPVEPGVSAPKGIPGLNDPWLSAVKEQHRSRFMPEEEPQPDVLYFLSFSIPEEGLKLMVPEARALNIPALVNGLVDNDFRKTVQAVFRLTQETNSGGVQIDPTQFTRYGITAVPALVVSCDDRHDVVYGNIRIKEALKRIAEHGDCSQVARQKLKAVGA